MKLGAPNLEAPSGRANNDRAMQGARVPIAVQSLMAGSHSKTLPFQNAASGMLSRPGTAGARVWAIRMQRRGNAIPKSPAILPTTERRDGVQSPCHFDLMEPYS